MLHYEKIHKAFSIFQFIQKVDIVEKQDLYHFLAKTNLIRITYSSTAASS